MAKSIKKNIYKAEKDFSSALIQQLGGACIFVVKMVSLANLSLPCLLLMLDRTQVSGRQQTQLACEPVGCQRARWEAEGR